MRITPQAIEALLQALHPPELNEIDLSLSRVERFMELLGSPQHRLPPVIHVAGTNGKGSLIACLQAICEAAGLSVHRYTSPHLVRFNERIVLAGREIGDDELYQLLVMVREKARVQPVTFFEATTAAAFLAFAAHPADVLLLEVGMGGRLDATNLIPQPLLTAITPVSLDHMEFLGDTLEKIAFEKAGILKPGVPCVVGPQLPEALAVIGRVAAEKHTPLFCHDREWVVKENGMYVSARWEIAVHPALAGKHQIMNATTAIACAEHLTGITREAVETGIASAKWPARLQLMPHPRFMRLLPAGSELWLDGGHNPAAGVELGYWAGQQQGLPLLLVCGMMKDKDAKGFLTPLAPYARALYAISIPGEPRSAGAAAIVAAAREAGLKAEGAEGIESALKAAGVAAGGPCRVLVCGSLSLAGKMLSMLSNTESGK